MVEKIYKPLTSKLFCRQDKPVPADNPQDQDRALHVEQADAENRIDGLFRDPKTDEAFGAYVSGEIEVTGIVARLHALLGV